MFGVYAALLTALGVSAGVLFWDARVEYNQLKAVEALKRREVTVLQAKLAEQQRILDRLRNDPEFVEQVIRRKMGYAKPGEVIFRYDN